MSQQVTQIGNPDSTVGGSLVVAFRTKRINRRADGAKSLSRLVPLKKTPTGIQGLDDISGGGVPTGRTTLLCGGPGCGKTLLGLEFLVHGVEEFNEPGVLIAFEESTEEVARNVASLGYDLKALSDRKMLFMDHVRIDPSEIEETGEYDLEGLFVRLQHAVDTVGAKRVMLDTPEALYSCFSNTYILRLEIQRVFRWLKDRGLTAIVTAEKGDNGSLTRHGFEEYISDCVILLDHRISEQISTRRMRIVKYRGTSHRADEYPFLINESGISILPVTSLTLEHKVSAKRIATGIADLDRMMGGKGYYEGSTILVSGTAGSGKTNLAAEFADAACRRGERCLFISFEESGDQLFRNVASLGIDLDQWVKKNLLFFRAWRPTHFEIEMHLLRIQQLVQELKPQIVVVDPVTNLGINSSQRDARSLLMRVIDFLKARGLTCLFTGLTKGGRNLEATEESISSLIDTWLLLRDAEYNGERNRCLYILKSRGMAHSNQLREFVMTSHGIKLLPVYVGGGQVLMGSSRLAQEARDHAEALARRKETDLRQEQLERKRAALRAQIDAMKAELEVEEQQMEQTVRQEQQRQKSLDIERKEMAFSRKAGSKQNLQPKVSGGVR
jgi:circadian clock protein KaiC